MTTIKKIFGFLLLLLPGLLLGQDQNKPVESRFYWVSFSDKNDTLFSTENPEVFLSQKAIDRREKFDIAITKEDFPVNPFYLDTLKSLGAKVHHTSRWLNAATILLPKKNKKVIADLSFVENIEYVGRVYPDKSVKIRQGNSFRDTLESEIVPEEYYGYASFQVKSIAIDSLHQMGFSGEGVTIAVLDGGFRQVDSIPFFDSLRVAGRLINHYDFVDGDHTVFESSSHGSQVLSTMAAKIPNVLVGTAPHANYLCLKTEDTRGEYRLEECNWVAAAEYADSIGADLINSSLGYSTFSDKSMNYSYDNLDGTTSISSQAGDIAFSKGMIVISSAGNEGASKWKYIGIPSDAKNVFTVGATNQKGERAGFSSIGPTPDGRIKPEIAAIGSWVAVTSTRSFRVNIGSGTSFSAPLIAGATACLWQAFPDKSNKEIIEAIKLSGSQSDAPDSELGYGVPSFIKAYEILLGQDQNKEP